MNQFKKFVFLLILFLSSCYGFSQEISIRGGFNLSQINYKAGDIVVHKDGTKLNPGFNIGPIIELPLKNIFTVETGILFSTKGHKLSGDPLAGVEKYLFQTNIFYLDIPVLLKATIPIKKTKIFAMAGGYAGGALYGNVIAEGKENTVIKRFKNKIQWGNNPNEYDRFDYGLDFGVGIKIKKYQIGILYESGLKNFSNDGTFKMRNRTIELYCTYKLTRFKNKNNNRVN